MEPPRSYNMSRIRELMHRGCHIVVVSESTWQLAPWGAHSTQVASTGNALFGWE
jgi:hypothetical protein